jgi:hypothetical protein
MDWQKACLNFLDIKLYKTGFTVALKKYSTPVTNTNNTTVANTNIIPVTN